MSSNQWFGRLALVGLVGGILASGTACKEKEPERVDPTKATFDDFVKRVEQYVALRNESAKAVGELDPTKSQAEIAARATSLGGSIIGARSQAKQGDIFTPEVGAIIATLIKEEYSRRPEPVTETREDQQDELPDFTPAVNALYPTTYPLATFPATLLPILPQLPKEVEYRIVQRYLILRDVEANLIIDYIPNAVPVGG